MRTSENTKELFTALIAAQAEMPVVEKDSVNPFFSNEHKTARYASLPSIVAIIQPILEKHKLAFIQGGCKGTTDPPIWKAPEGRKAGCWAISMTIQTRIIHASGQWIEDDQVMWVESPNPQRCGHVSTYGRRYGLSSMLGLVTDTDDDGNDASGNKSGAPSAGSSSSSATIGDLL